MTNKQKLRVAAISLDKRLPLDFLHKLVAINFNQRQNKLTYISNASLTLSRPGPKAILIFRCTTDHKQDFYYYVSLS